MSEPSNVLNFDKRQMEVIERFAQSVARFFKYADWNADLREYAFEGYPLGKSECGFKKWRKRQG